MAGFGKVALESTNSVKARWCEQSITPLSSGMNPDSRGWQESDLDRLPGVYQSPSKVSSFRTAAGFFFWLFFLFWFFF